MKNNLTKLNPTELILKSINDVNLLVERGFQFRKLLVFQTNLAPEFFDLSTGIAGEVLQKLVNYKIQTAFVIDLDSIPSKAFKELVTETNSNDEYRFFENETDAVNWLKSL